MREENRKIGNLGNKLSAYTVPRTEVHVLTCADGWLQSLSLNGAENASEHGNPPMDVKGVTGNWDDIWSPPPTPP